MRPSGRLEVADRIRAGEVDEANREAFLRYLSGKPKLAKKAWNAVRRSPVLRDHRGDWGIPARMVPRSVAGVQLLEPALQLVPDGTGAELRRHIRFRQKLGGGDLVALARLVEQGAVDPSVMRSALSRHANLVTDSVSLRLKDIAFLATASGEVLRPLDVYIAEAQTVAVLGDGAPYALDVPVNVLRRLGCRTEPLVDDILASLERIRAAGTALARPDAVYRALRAAVRSEGYPVAVIARLPIVSTARGWEPPDECLVGVSLKGIFLDAVTVLGDSPRDSWRTLGVPSEPQPWHWLRLFEWIDTNYGASGRVPRRVADALDGAYRSSVVPPEGIPTATRFLLGDDGRLHSRTDALARRFVINDYPVLAAALIEAGAEVSFVAASSPAIAHFYAASGVLHLTEVARRLPTAFGEEAAPGPSVRAIDVLERVRAPMFASALSALANSLCGFDERRTAAVLEEQLGHIHQIDFVTSIHRRWTVAGTTVSVVTVYEVEEARVVLARPSGRSAFLRSLATALAVIADPDDGERRLADAAYFLVACRNSAEMRDELARKRIPWRAGDGESISDDDDQEVVDSEGLLEVITDSLNRAVVDGTRSNSATAPGPQPVTPQRDPILRGPLPDPGAVQPVEVSSLRPAAPSSGGGGGGWSGAWSPRSPEEVEQDRRLGRQAEEVVFRLEQARVEKLGRSAEVVWTADANPYADHDIQSVDDDGAPLWVEVKATTGRDGRFVWPVSEFKLAARERSRYVLYRVYEADTENPRFKRVRDPVGELDTGRLRLDLERFTGDVGVLDVEPEVVNGIEPDVQPLKSEDASG